MSNLYRFEIFKRSQLWTQLNEWHNFHICDVARFPGSVEDTAIRLVLSECELHQQHIEFLRVNCQAVDDQQPGVTADNGDLPLPGETTTRVYTIPNGARFGRLETDGENCEKYVLRVSKDTTGARNGFYWFRGCLGPSDVIIESDGSVRMKDVLHWRDRVHEEFAFPFGFEPDRFYVERKGKNALKLGNFQQVEALTVRGVTTCGNLLRSQKRIPTARQNHYNAIILEGDILATLWQTFREWRFLGTDFNPTTLLDTALEIMAICLGMSKEVVKAVMQDNSGQCSDAPTYNTRFGPTSGALLGFASLAVTPVCSNPETKETYNKAFEKLSIIAPDVFVPSGIFYSQAQLSKMEEIFRPFLMSGFQMARGDYLPTLPRAFPPLPLA